MIYNKTIILRKDSNNFEGIEYKDTIFGNKFTILICYLIRL